MLYNDRNETDLYDCFSFGELKRLREIKDDPKWRPRDNRTTHKYVRLDWRRYESLPNGANVMVQVKMSAPLKARVVAKCGQLGISMSEYIRALLEVTT